MLDNELISLAVQLIKTNNGEFNYIDIGKALTESNLQNDGIGLLLAISVVCHNIPYYKDNQRLIRNIDECLKDAITFYNSNKAELEIVNNSCLKEWQDLLSGFILPKLYFGDDSHYVFKSGSGTARPDLKDAEGKTYEVKRNFRGGSRASLHKADYLIDCLNTTIEIRKISDYGSVDLDHYPIARFNGFLGEKLGNTLTNVPIDIAQKLLSGELITEVERVLQEEGFVWNP